MIFWMLFLRYCAVIEHRSACWAVKCLDRPGTVLGSAFCYCSAVCVLPYLLKDLTMVCIFVFQLWTSLMSFHCAKTFAENLFEALFIPLNWNLLKFKSGIWLWKSVVLLPNISSNKLELCDCNWTRTQNGAFDCMFLSCHVRVWEWIPKAFRVSLITDFTDIIFLI